MKQEIFVFVVCGAKEYIDTLHFSLSALKKYSSKKIIVITDKKRNEIEINHTNIIDIVTPEKFNNHQASIFLKTKVNRLLHEGNLYCYLDSDVIAVSKKVDSIFEKFISPVLFAPDHCRINGFSPFAMNCSCRNETEKYYRAAVLYNNTLGAEHRRVLNEIDELTAYNKRNVIAYISSLLNYHTSGKYYKLRNGYSLEKKTGRWLNKVGEDIDEKYNRVKFIVEQIGLAWDNIVCSFIRQDGNDIENPECLHLHLQIKKNFDIEIQPDDWQHWNGGVFLFDENSHPFMDFWHEATMKIFDNPAWKTRDQGALAATVWKFGLEHHPVLDKTYNLIIDYNKNDYHCTGNLNFKLDEKIYKPFFLHIFHHFGDKNWVIWQDVEKHIKTD